MARKAKPAPLFETKRGLAKATFKLNTEHHIAQREENLPVRSLIYRIGANTTHVELNTSRSDHHYIIDHAKGTVRVSSGNSRSREWLAHVHSFAHLLPVISPKVREQLVRSLGRTIEGQRKLAWGVK